MCEQAEAGLVPWSARVVVEDQSEPVRVITAETATEEEPFAVRNAGPGNHRSLYHTGKKYLEKDRSGED